MFFRKEKKYFSVEEAAAFLGKSIGQIDLYIWLNKIPNVQKSGNSTLIPREEIYKLQDLELEEKSSKKVIYEVDSYENESFSYL
ncbi:MAG: hypothetical protein ACM34K_01795 [Bacillota bacterium]